MQRSTNHLAALFAQSAAAHSSKVFLSTQQQDGFLKKTYSEVYDESLRLASFLKSRYIGAQDKVAIYLENGPAFVASFFGVMNLGAVAVPLDIQYSPEQLNTLLLHSEAKAVILTEKNFNQIKGSLSGINAICIDAQATVREVQSCAKELAGPAPVRESDALAVMFYTSGTTDAPKAVMLTHANLSANVTSIKKLNILEPTDVVISFLPLHHAYAFTVTLLCPCVCGASIVYPNSLSAVELLRCVRESKTTIFVGVPRVFELICKGVVDKLAAQPLMKKILASFLAKAGKGVKKITGANLNKKIFAPVHKAFGDQLRFMVSGGAKLEPEVAEAFTDWGFTILEGYGLTETSPVVAFSPADAPKIGSVGKPLSGVSLKIVDPDNEGIGEVAVKGANLMRGYYKMSKETDEVIRDGWFYTGDLGKMDKNGYLFLAGRKKEMIILSNGENLNPEAIESQYNQIPFIKEIGVLAWRDPAERLGAQQLVAAIVPDQDYFRAQGETNIQYKIKWELENIAVKLPSTKRLKGFVISQDPLPRTRLGKLMRFKLNNLYDVLNRSKKVEVKEGIPAGREAENAAQLDLTQKALAYMEKFLNKLVSLQDHLELDLGLDSLNKIELLMSLQEHLSLKLDPDELVDFFMCSTVEELVAKLEEQAPPEQEQAKAEKSFDWQGLLREPLQEGTQKKIKLKFGPLAVIFNIIMISAFKGLFAVLFLLKQKGKENLPASGPYLICPNHTSYFDGLFVLCALPFKIALQTYFVGYGAFFESPWLKPFIRIARLIPMVTNINLIEALKASSYVLQHQKIVVYFPEGQRSIDGSLNEFKKGVGILVKELNVPVVPVYIEGAIKTWPRSRKWPRLAPVTVVFGKKQMPQELLPAEMSLSPDEVYSQAADKLRQVVDSIHSLSSIIT